MERIWRSRSDRAGEFLSLPASHFEIAITRHRGRTFLTLRGPETIATPAACPAEGDWVGIRFTLGTFMPRLPPGRLLDRRDVTLPAATDRTFWLDGSAWEYPDFDNAETFVARLARKGVIAHDASVDAAVRAEPGRLPPRSSQRHFLRAVGIPLQAVRRIERARHAAMLLQAGVSIVDAACEAGYFDQAHLTRSLNRLIGQTPGAIKQGRQQLSFLYKTRPLP